MNAYMYGHATMVKGGDDGTGGEASANSGREKDTESNRERRELAEIRRKLGTSPPTGKTRRGSALPTCTTECRSGR